MFSIHFAPTLSFSGCYHAPNRRRAKKKMTVSFLAKFSKFSPSVRGKMFKACRLLSECRWRSAVPKRPLVSPASRSVSRLCCRPAIIHRPELHSTTSRRYKRTKKQDDDDDGEGSDEDLEIDDSSQLMKFRTSTMRMDTVLKHALGKSRNKIELAFYESRIRVNGEKVTKKSHAVEVGDEIDLVKGPSPENPDFLLISRVEVLSAKLDDEELEVKLRKFKNLLINNYQNKWKSSS